MSQQMCAGTGQKKDSAANVPESVKGCQEHTSSANASSHQAASLTFVSGKIASTSVGSITVTPASGTSVTVQIATTTRISKLVTTSISSVQVGQSVQVTPDASGTVAQRITVQGGAGRGSIAGGQPSATRVPGSRFNPACFRRTGQGNGGFGVTGGQGGRVSQVSPLQIELTDAQGQTLTYGISANTVILTPAMGSASDLKTGATVAVSGQAGASSITARSIVVTSSGQ